MSQKTLNMLGLAQKAGKLKSGEFSTEKAVKERKAFLVVVASDASDNTKKMFQNMCSYYGVPYFVFSTKEQLGHAIGKRMRASCACTEAHFSEALIRQLEQINLGNRTGGNVHV